MFLCTGCCVYFEQLCLVLSGSFTSLDAWMLRISTPSSLIPRPPVNLWFIPVFYSIAGYLRAWDQTSKQTEQQKNPSPRQGWSGLEGEMGEEILFAYWASSISLWWQKRPPRTWLYPHFCLTSGVGGSSQSSVHTDTSSSDPISCWLKPRACSLYLSCSFSSLACSLFERLVGAPFDCWPFTFTSRWK